MRTLLKLVVLLALAGGMLPQAAIAAPPPVANPSFKVLAFHAGNPNPGPGLAAIKAAGKAGHFAVVDTADPAKINRPHLQQYNAVVFLNTGLDVLNATQEAAFQAYFGGGGGFVGIGSAIETEPEWAFYTDILGTRATGRTDVQPGTIKVADRGHDASRDLP
jgi:hypothetical protein